MPEKIVQLNEEVIKGQLKELVRGSVEETLNELLEAEGYVSSVPGKGSFAAPHSQVDSARRDGLLRTFDETATELFFLGLSADALSQRLSKLDGGVRQ